MSGPAFDDELRRRLAANLAGFARQPIASESLRRAAVAVVITASGTGNPAFLLTRRASAMRAHPGQFALPGGRVDHGETVEQAALRELHEELGVELGPGVVLGLLDDYETRSGYAITPVVVWGGHDLQLTPNPTEVATVYVVDLADVGSPRFIAIPESDRPVIQLPLVGTLVHAPTAAIVWQAHEVALHGRPTRVAHLEQPVFAWR